MRTRRRDPPPPPPVPLRALTIERVTIVVPARYALSSNDWVHLGHLVTWLRAQAQAPANDQGGGS